MSSMNILDNPKHIILNKISLHPPISLKDNKTEVSRPTELPHRPLFKPYVNLSAHTASVRQPIVLSLASNVQTVAALSLIYFL